MDQPRTRARLCRLHAGGFLAGIVAGAVALLGALVITSRRDGATGAVHGH